MRHLGALAALCGVTASYAASEPLFVDASRALPSEHLYTGGWEHFVGGGVAVFDCNQDQRPDLYVAGGTAPAQLFVQRASEKLEFETGREIPVLTNVTGAYPIDIDSDGNVDLMVLRVGENRILRGDGACGFSDATHSWGFKTGARWSTAFSATWEDGQSWPTLAIGNYVDRSDPDGPFEACDANLIYRPKGREYSDPVHLTPGYCALSMLFSDWTRSGAVELRISNDRHYYVRGGYEQMWRLNPLKERDEADGWDRVSLWGMGIASADLQRDGFPDVMLTSMGDQVLHMNEAGRIKPAGFATGATAHRPHVGDDGRPSTGWHAEFGDVDNDGLLDLFIAKGNVDQMPGSAMQDPNNLLMQTTGGTFSEAAAQAGIASVARSRGAALADLDRDGRLDLIVVNRRAPLEIWMNRSADAGNWATVELRMSGANRFAIGAWLEIDRGQATEWRERTIGGGHASGSLLPLHLGLGDSEDVRLRVWWPDGTATDWRTIRAGQHAKISP